ncbi:hypothetical protein CTEN210_15039 [Chaetoceros tenuissimus]|uniref:Uncharacterized protein n=1 Tax=Chaetoceros tenuissimus TaxID=426638 RepID=A0AAD3HCZ8_9STRA|nr:hypothetical protein CTEN210_15039 [Chaetoceros tenuissimus]
MEVKETVLAPKTLELIEKITRNDDVLFQKEADSFGIEECLDYSDSDSSDESSVFQSMSIPRNSPKQQLPQQCNEKNYDGNTPFLLACRKGDLSLMTLLMSQENINEINDRKNNPLHVILENNQNLDSNAFDFLLENQCHVNAENIEGLTPLHIAAQIGSIRCVNKLLEHGACSRLKDDFGNLPLHYAVSNHSSVELVQALSSEKACSNQCIACNLLLQNTQSDLLQTESNLSQMYYESNGYKQFPEQPQITGRHLEIWDSFFRNALDPKSSDEVIFEESSSQSLSDEKASSNCSEKHIALTNKFQGEEHIQAKKIESVKTIPPVDKIIVQPQILTDLNEDKESLLHLFLLWIWNSFLGMFQKQLNGQINDNLDIPDDVLKELKRKGLR